MARKTKAHTKRVRVLRLRFVMFDVCESWCVIGPWPQARKEIVRRFKWPVYQLPDEGEIARGWFFSDNKSQRGIIWIGGCVTAGDLATLAHEAVHLMVRTMDWIGIKVDTNSDEVVAHGVSFIMRSVINAMPRMS